MSTCNTKLISGKNHGAGSEQVGRGSLVQAPGAPLASRALSGAAPLEEQRLQAQAEECEQFEKMHLGGDYVPGQ